MNCEFCGGLIRRVVDFTPYEGRVESDECVQCGRSPQMPAHVESALRRERSVPPGRQRRIVPRTPQAQMKPGSRTAVQGTLW